jgi:hypothetical protein
MLEFRARACSGILTASSPSLVACGRDVDATWIGGMNGLFRLLIALLGGFAVVALLISVLALLLS